MQCDLFDALERPSTPDPGPARRLELGQGAWIETAPEWLPAHGRLFDELRASVDWHRHRRVMYDRVVDVPRLTGVPAAGTAASERIRHVGAMLSAHYERDLSRVALAYYRGGDDSVAMHGDKMGSIAADTVVAIVSVGAPRKLLLRPVDRGTPKSFLLGWGDLFVMGGTCQTTFLHGVPKVAHAEPRISIMFREPVPDAEIRGGGVIRPARAHSRIRAA